MVKSKEEMREHGKERERNDESGERKKRAEN